MSAREKPGRVVGRDEDAWWAAVLRRDAGYTGHFVFGVRTTGIYCRPGCPARQPGRDRVVFFAESVEAEEAGFRACKRCHPKLFEEAREKQRLDEELKVAAAIQQQLRPVTTPSLEGWELAGNSVSCRAVGGDYYDFIESRDRRRMAVAIGDVAGKGPGAALLMSSLHAAVRAQSQLGLPVNEVVEAVNRYLCENSPEDKFVTLFYAEVELDSGRIEYVNAGHLPALLRRTEGPLDTLNGGGVPLGILLGTGYPRGEARLEPGDLLVLYSDGISESINEQGEEFGKGRIIAAVEESSNDNAESLCARLRERCAGFAGRAAMPDDRTIVAVQRKAEPRVPEQRLPILEMAQRER